jgi:hypothetical protein
MGRPQTRNILDGPHNDGIEREEKEKDEQNRGLIKL